MRAGDGYAMRAEDAMLHGCIPVVIMDDILPVFGTHLDWPSFSVRVAETDVERLPEILHGIVASGQAQVRPTLSRADHDQWCGTQPGISHVQPSRVRP